MTLVCGHYEGIDQRVIDAFGDEEISIGDYVLTGGELASLVVADSVLRLQPGVLAEEKGCLLYTSRLLHAGPADHERPAEMLTILHRLDTQEDADGL